MTTKEKSTTRLLIMFTLSSQKLTDTISNIILLKHTHTQTSNYNFFAQARPTMLSSFRSGMSVEELLKAHKYEVLPSGGQDRTRLIVRRKHILTDTLHWMRNGADLSQPLNIVFMGESAVDDGGPLREFLYKVVAAAVRNESLFCGPVNSRVPRHNLPASITLEPSLLSL